MTTIRYYDPLTDRTYEDYDAFFDFVVGELGPARRHLERIRAGSIPLSLAVAAEIHASIDRAVVALSQLTIVVVTGNDILQEKKDG